MSNAICQVRSEQHRTETESNKYFLNSIHVYDDKMLLLFNYKGGKKSLTFDELESYLNDKNTHKSECSSLFKSGDPYGNRKLKPIFPNFVLPPANVVDKPIYDKLQQMNFPIFS